MVSRSIAVTPEDAETYRRIAGKGFALDCRLMPTDRSQDFLHLLDKKKL